MAINIGDNFKYKGKEPNFDRDKFMTLTEMKSVSDTDIDEGHISFCVETGEHYKFSSENEADSTTGKWRLLVTQVGKKDDNTIIPEGGPQIPESEMKGEVFNAISLNTATGVFSHAEGYRTTASGDCSHAEGHETTASGYFSHASGGQTIASGYYSHAEGGRTEASGVCSHAEGYRTTASGISSHAEGYRTTASGDSSHAEGLGTEAENYVQSSHGQFNGKEPIPSPNTYDPTKTIFSIGNGTSDKERSDALRMLGNGTTWIEGIGGFTGTNPEETNSLQAVINDISKGTSGGGGLGKKDDNTIIPSSLQFSESDKEIVKGEIFNLTKDISKEDSDTLPSNKATGIFSHAEGCQTTANGYYSHAEGGYTTASGVCSHAEGAGTTASGDSSHAEGAGTTASGDYSHAEGFRTEVNGNYSHAEGCQTTANGNYSHAEGSSTEASGVCSHAEGAGTTASGNSSHAEGQRTTASGNYSHASGGYTESAGFAQTAIGYKNTAEPSPSIKTYNETKLAFIVGANNKNAFEVYFNGNTNQNGTASHAGADYAEMFEWSDGNVNSEDRIGRFVTMEGDKIKLANKDSKYIVGIISGNPVVLGNEPMEWHGKYINDEWGRPTYMHHEFENEKQKINPKTKEIEKEIVTKKQYTRTVAQNYDESLIYTSRRDRKEWDAVGMLGQLIVLQDGSLKAGEFCYPSIDGIATNSESGYYVMKVLNEKQALIIIK